jgi:hypothetical protein
MGAPFWERVGGVRPRAEQARDRLRVRIVAAVGPPVRAWLAPRVGSALAGRRAQHAAMDEEISELRRVSRAIAREAEAVHARLDRSPFVPAMTVHAAHARHPGVQAIFAAHGLPRCPDCAVGADETLAEAAFGEDLPLGTLLAELNALLEVFR